MHTILVKKVPVSGESWFRASCEHAGHVFSATATTRKSAVMPVAGELVEHCSRLSPDAVAVSVLDVE